MKRLKAILHVSFRVKLLVASVSVVVLSLMLGGFAEYTIDDMTGDVRDMAAQAALTEALSTASSKSHDAMEKVWTAAFDYDGTAGSADRWKMDDAVKAAKELGTFLAENEKLVAAYPAATEVYQKLKESAVELETQTEALVAAMTEAKTARSDLKDKISTLTDVSSRFSDLVGGTNTEAKGVFEKNAADSVAQGRAATLFSIVMLSLVALISAGTSYYIYLSTRKLAAATKRLGASSAEVGKASAAIGEASIALSERAAEQAAALDESVTSMEEMSAMIAQTAANVEKTLASAEAAQKEAHDGAGIVRQLQDAMREIDASNARLAEITGVIKQIGAKTSVINDIVFETRLLALNASIEAARAGQHGKGFAVVAEQVGNLAKMSGNAATEINGLLAKSDAQVGEAITQIGGRVKTGLDISQACAKAFDVVTDSINRLTPLVQNIAVASKEQQAGVQQANTAMGQMDQVTNQNARSAEEMATQGGRLRSQAEALDSEVGLLVGIVMGGARPQGGASGAAAPTAPGNAEMTPTTRTAEAAGSTPQELKATGSEGAAAAAPKSGRHLRGLPSPDDPRFK